MNFTKNNQDPYPRRKSNTRIVFWITILLVATHLFVAQQVSANSSYASLQRLEVRVDLITIHHYHDENGNYVFTQLIFSEWCRNHNRYLVREWRLVKNRMLQTPYRRGAGYAATVMCDKLRITVSAPALIEYGHQRYLWGVDPERVNRQYLPEDQRRPLRESLFLFTKR